MYKYYGAPAVAFRAGSLAEHDSSDDEPVTCEVCEIRCNTPYHLRIHETGKKHKMNLEMLQRKIRKTSNLVKKIPKVVQPAACEVCKGQRNSRYSLRSHETCKHKNNLVELQDSITPEPAKPPNDAVGASTTPAAVPDGVMTVVQDSITPKQENPLDSAVGESTAPTAAVADGVMTVVQPKKNKRSAATPQDLEEKKRRVLEAGAAEGELQICTMSNAVKKIPNVVQAVTCEVCKVQCTSLNDLRAHETGKKHKKNLEKLQDSITPEPVKPASDAVGASTEPAAAAVADGVIPAVQPKRNKRSAGTPEDLEAKRRRVVADGIPEGEVKICMMCNVVVSRQEDLESHIAGHRHTTKLRKQQQVQPLPQVA